MTATATWRELFDRLAIALQADALARHRRKLKRKPSWMLQHLRALKDPAPAEVAAAVSPSMGNYTPMVTPKRAPRQPSSHVGRLFAPSAPLGVESACAGVQAACLSAALSDVTFTDDQSSAAQMILQGDPRPKHEIVAVLRAMRVDDARKEQMRKAEFKARYGMRVSQAHDAMRGIP